MAIYVKCASSAHHGQCGQQPYQPETVVAMYVRNEDMIKTGQMCLLFSDADLGSLTTVNQQQFLMSFQNLGRLIGSGGGHGRSSAQYG
jgi:hypothetical protein